MQMAAYTLQSPAPPFPVFVMAFTINGFGISIQDAQANGYVASLEEGVSTKMGILHGVYGLSFSPPRGWDPEVLSIRIGLGAFAAPLVATQFAQQKHWSFHYLVSLGIATLNVIAQSAVFKMRSTDGMVISQKAPFLLDPLLYRRMPERDWSQACREGFFGAKCVQADIRLAGSSHLGVLHLCLRRS